MLYFPELGSFEMRVAHLVRAATLAVVAVGMARVAAVVSFLGAAVQDGQQTIEIIVSTCNNSQRVRKSPAIEIFF